MKTVILLLVFAVPPHQQPVRPHEMLRFYHEQDCELARSLYAYYSDGQHGYECVPGVVVD